MLHTMTVMILVQLSLFQPNSAKSLGQGALVSPLLMPLMSSGQQPAL